MLPHEKALVQRLQTEPFSLLGLNSDGEADAVRKILSENDINWRQAILGSTDGELAQRWNVHSWPNIFVLDAKGVIRYRDVRDQQMEDAVTKLLAELKGSK